MKTVSKYIVTALIALVIGAFASSRWNKSRGNDIVIEYDTIYERVIDSVPFKVYDTIKLPPKIVTIEIPQVDNSGTPTGETVQVETKKYTGKEELENGTIFWSAYADKLYATEFKLETEKETIIKTVTETLPAKSRLYLATGVDINWGSKYPQAAEVGLMYNRRQKWAIGAVIRHDFSKDFPLPQRTTFGVRLHIGL